MLSDVITKLGDKEKRTSEESRLLARALKQTGDDAATAAAKMVLADAAVARVGEQMKASEQKSSGLNKALKGLSINPGLAGPLVALTPALGVLGGVVAGVGVGLAGAFVAGGAALAAFGAVARPVLTDAKTAATAVEKAQNNYAIAIANGTKQSVAYKAEQIAIAKAYANLSPAQIALSQQLGAMAKAWDAVKAAQTPVIAGALQPWLKSVTDLTKQLGPIIAAVAPVIRSLGTQFGILVSSSAFTAFRDFIANTGSKAVGAAGGTLIDFVDAFITLLPKFNPLIEKAIGWIAALGPAVARWANSQKTADQITAFMGWFTKNGPQVGTLLTNLGGALKALAPGLTSGGAFELKVISDFLGLIAKLPPAIAKPLAEVAGAMLILSKMGVLKIGVQVLGLGGAGGAAGAGTAAAEGAAAGGLWSKILPGARLVGGALVISLIIDQILQNPKNPKVLGNTDPNAPWNSWTSNQSLGGKAINFIAGLFHQATVSIQADFNTQAKAAGNATTAIGQLTSSFTRNGAATWATGPARQNLIADLIAAGVKSTVAQADVYAYTGAIAANGVKSAQAAGARAKLISDILAASANAKIGRDDLGAFTVAVQSHSSKSDAVRSARTRLINDLVNSGLSAKASKALVDGLQTSINNMKGKNVSVGVTGSGHGGVVITTSGLAAAGQGNIRFVSGNAARGLYVDRGAGPTADDVLIRASRGELIVPAHLVKAGTVDHLRGQIPGFAAGGFAGIESALGSMTGTAAGFEGRGGAAAMAAGVKAAIAREKAAIVKAASVGNYKPGAGVQQWRGTVRQALGLAGANVAQLTDPVLYQMQTESGGNPTIVNRTDSNWLAGHPSVGLMQVIAGTFASYAGRFRNTGPFEYGVSVNPLANIYSAIKYAQAAYGPGLRNAYGGIGSGHGYDQGGWLMPGVTLAVNSTGRPEAVIPGGGLDGLAAELRALRGQVAELIRTTAAVPAATGRHVAAGVNGAAADAVFRGRYPGR